MRRKRASSRQDSKSRKTAIHAHARMANGTAQMMIALRRSSVQPVRFIELTLQFATTHARHSTSALKVST
jgi:hypothetical protein